MQPNQNSSNNNFPPNQPGGNFPNAQNQNQQTPPPSFQAPSGGQNIQPAPGFPMNHNRTAPNNSRPMAPGPAGPGMPPPPQQQMMASGSIEQQDAKNQENQRKSASTQNSLRFSEIRDNMVIMLDGSFRAVVACKSINFDLMSVSERESVEYSYQNFINSLTHPVQILIRSQKVDIGPYLERLIKIRKTQDNMLLGILMDDYIDFIDILSQEANIMDKQFYIVIPYSYVGDLSNIRDAGKGFFSKMFGGNGGPKITKIDKISYEKAKDEISNRVDSVTNGLFQMGVHSTRLNSKELGQLFYNYYNPDTAIRQPLGNFKNNTFMYVKKGEGNSIRPDLNNLGDL